MSEMNLNEATGWRPNEGDTLVGRVSDVSKGWSDFLKGNYPIITVTPESGGDPVAVHCFHAALFRRVMELRPQPGERIGIAFKGQRPHKTNANQTVSVYVVRVERDTPRAVENVYASMEDLTDQPVTDSAVAAGMTPGPDGQPADDDIPF